MSIDFSVFNGPYDPDESGGQCDLREALEAMGKIEVPMLPRILLLHPGDMAVFGEYFPEAYSVWVKR